MASTTQARTRTSWRPRRWRVRSSRSRVETLDGLRGFLALAVFFHHGALYHTFIQDGLWRPPPDRFYALLGPFGVALFFREEAIAVGDDKAEVTCARLVRAAIIDLVEDAVAHRVPDLAHRGERGADA